VKYSPALFGVAFACALPRERAKIRESLRRLCGPRGAVEETIDVVRTFVAYAHCLTESLASERAEAEAAVPVVHGSEHLQAAIERGKGVIIATAHAGAWDAAARFLARDYAQRVLVVMAREPDRDAAELQDVIRERSGLLVAHVGGHPTDALKLLGHLRRGGVVAVQLDRSTGPETMVEVALSGMPFGVPVGPFKVAQLTGAPIVPVFTRRSGYFRHEVEISAPIFVDPGSGEAGVAVAAGHAARAMEGFLTANPTQWFHFAH
jgi:KDO2-lipid IV(A) lauroyltransferase